MSTHHIAGDWYLVKDEIGMAPNDYPPRVRDELVRWRLQYTDDQEKFIRLVQEIFNPTHEQLSQVMARLMFH